MNKKIIGILICMLLILTVLPVSGTVEVEKNNVSPMNDGTLSGYVTDSAMNPLEGALVRVYFHGTYEEDYADSLGYYHVTNIPICNCTKNCTASKPGYKSEWVLLGIVEDTTYDFVLTSGNVLYVGGSGPGNYSTIQEAIDDTVDGDTVFVYDESSPYYETLVIEKSIYLIGEAKETTIIDANEQDKTDVILIKSDEVTIQGFTIQNTGPGYYPDYANGIEIWSNNNTIQDNIITDAKMGIQLGEEVKYQGHKNNLSNFNIIEGNTITKNDFTGINLIDSNGNKIKRNIVTDNGYHGVFLFGDNCRNQIGQNIITNHNQTGVLIHGGSNNTILQNHIEGNKYGITISYSSLNYINYNNIYDNKINAFVDADSLNFIISKLKYKERYFSHSWDENYWGRPYLGPKPIMCLLVLTAPTLLIGQFLEPFIGFLIPFFLPIPQLDWHPAQEPYDI